MRKFWDWFTVVAVSFAAAVAVAVGVSSAQEEPPGQPATCLKVYNFDEEHVGYAVYEGVSPSECVPTTTTTTSTTISPTTTTTIPSTTTTQPTTTTSTTTTTTTEPPGGGFVETFTGNTGDERFVKGVFQRNVDVHNFHGASGGTWRGDHSMSCSGVGYSTETTRSLSWQTSQSQAQRVATAFYNCNDHMMTSMGDVDGYSVTWFKPDVVFNDVERVCWDVNLTSMGNRQWFEVAVVPVGEPELFSDVDAADLPDKGPNTDVFIYNSLGATKRAMFNGFAFGPEYDAGTDKASRYQHCFVDNGNGTMSVTQDRGNGAVSVTGAESLPNGPVTVIFKAHSYTPDKSEFPFTRPAYTWHWDNIVVE